MKYDRLELNEVCSLSQGLQIPIAERFRENGPNRYFYITVQFLKDGSDKYFIENPPERVKCSPEDILVVRTGNTGQIITGVDGCFHNNFFKVEPNEKVYPKFLYYTLKSPELYTRMRNVASGTTILDLKHSAFLGLDIYLPDLNNQKKIAHILDIIDQKIKTCESINKNLENLLMAIFTSWFINFENYDKSNGMKNDDSYGEVPKSWSVEMLEDYVDFVTGVEPGSKNYHEKPEDNDIPFLRVGDLGSKDNAIFINPSLSKNKILEYDDIVLSLDATIGIVKMGLEGAYSTGMRKLVIKNDNINKPFLYCLVKSERIQRIIETFATGTTILHAGKSIKHMNFALSDKQIMDKFGEIGNPIISTILANLKEIEKLTNMRDTLLPKLMSGEIDVSKINCDLE